MVKHGDRNVLSPGNWHIPLKIEDQVIRLASFLDVQRSFSQNLGSIRAREGTVEQP